MHKLLTIVVAAGSGLRMGKEIPKQFLLLDGEPIVMRTMRALHQAVEQSLDVNKFVHEMLILLPPDYIETWRDWCEKYRFEIPHQVAAGGKTRFESVRNGLKATDDADYIWVHDGVRPFVNPAMTGRLIEAMRQHPAVIPAVPVIDSLRMLETNETGKVTTSKPVDRSLFRAVQTPQVFRGDLLRKAYEACASEDPNRFTDDASVIEAATDVKITLTEGDPGNIKITTPFDLKLAEQRMKDENL